MAMVSQFVHVVLAVGLLAGCASSPATAGAEVSTCHAGILRLKVAASGAVMSQPFVDISLRNTAGTTCRLHGYPTIHVTAQSAHGARSVVPTVVRSGSIYERRDFGPTRVVLAPHAVASFSLGTNTAQGKRLLTITRLAVTPPGSTQAIPISVRLPATRPVHQPVPIVVTAIHAGTGSE
jgi:hypothetical protein